MVARLRSALSRVLSLFRGRDLNERMCEEWRLHADLLTEEIIGQGLPADEARREARIALGSRDRFIEECREANGFRWFDELRQDLSYGSRILARSPTFTLMVVITLALGIGATTAAVSVIDAFLLRPFPVLEPDRLVGLSQRCSYPDFLDYRSDGMAFTDMAAMLHLPDGREGFSVDQPDAYVPGEGVTANYFDVLGLKMLLGRGFVRGEDEYPGNHTVVVISYRYWQRTLGSDLGVIGRTLRLDGEPMTIVGVAPPGFRGLDMGVAPTDIWIPISMLERVKHLEKFPPMHNIQLRRQDRWIEVFGRLRPGMPFQQARVRLDIINGQLRSAYPQTNKDWRPTLNPIGRRRLTKVEPRLLAAILSTASGCFLLIACTNVATLMSVRAWARQRELAIRMAVGATRARLARQLLTEGLELSALALVAGLGVFDLLTRLLPYFARLLDPALDIPLSLDTRVLVVAASTSTLAGLASSLAPALFGSRRGLATAIKRQGSFRFRIAGTRWLGALVVIQVIVSVVLLIGAGMITRVILHFQSVDPGFRCSDVVLVPTSLLSKYGYDPARDIGFCYRSLNLIRTLPGVRSASWGAALPLDSDYLADIRADTGDNSYRSTDCNYVTPEYLKTMGIPILQGRDFNEHDTASSARVIIVNDSLARRCWPGRSPLGRRIEVEDPDRGSLSFEVVGVARDAKYETLWEASKPFAYFIGSQYGWHDVLHVRAQGNPRALFDPIQKALDSVEPGVQMGTPRLVSDLISSCLSQEQSMASLLGVFGLAGLFVTAVGLYGVISFLSSQRTREFGIRIALGARPTDIILLVFAQGMTLVLIGLSVSLPCSYGLTRYIASRLHGMDPFDMATYAAVCLVCLLVASLAVLIPARRATANPTDALRCD